MNIECLKTYINILYKQPATSGTLFWNYITEAFEKVTSPRENKHRQTLFSADAKYFKCQ